MVKLKIILPSRIGKTAIEYHIQSGLVFKVKEDLAKKLKNVFCDHCLIDSIISIKMINSQPEPIIKACCLSMESKIRFILS